MQIDFHLPSGRVETVWEMSYHPRVGEEITWSSQGDYVVKSVQGENMPEMKVGDLKTPRGTTYADEVTRAQRDLVRRASDSRP